MSIYLKQEVTNCFSNDGAFTRDGILFLLKHDISGLTIDIFKRFKFNIYDLEPLPKLDYTCKTNIIKQNLRFEKYQNLKLNDLQILRKNEFSKYIFENYDTFNEVTESELCCWVIVLSCNPDSEYILNMLKDVRLLYATRDSRNKWLKQLHNNIRVTDMWYTGQHVNPDTAINLQYLNMCLSRDVFDVKEIDEDMIKRGSNTLIKQYIVYENDKIQLSRSKYYSVLENELDTMFAKALIKFNHEELISLETFIQISELWVTSGSASGAKTTDGILLNKRAAFEFGYITYETLMKSKPQTWVTVTTKFENGKNRALYPVDVTTYTMTSYILYFIEKYMPNVDGYCANLNNNQQLMSELLRQHYVDTNEICYMWDFADFNYTHELDSLALVYKCLLKWFNEHVHDEMILKDLKYVCNWLIDATYNHYLTNSTNTITIKRMCSLMSGSRDTSFMNTTLNIAYIKVVQKNILDVCNIDILKNYYCMGDDQYITLYREIDCYLYRYFMLTHGHEGNMIKITRRGEFLRYSMTKECGIKGFLNRALVNLVTRDQNRTDYKNPITVPNGMVTQCKKCISRGALPDVMKIILQILLDKHTLVYNEDKTKVKKVESEYIYSMKINNGMGIADLNNNLNNVIWSRQIVISDIALKDKMSHLPSVMTDNYFKWISKKLNIEIKDLELKKQIMVSNFSSFRGPSERAKNKIDIYHQICQLKQVGVSEIDEQAERIAKKCADDVCLKMLDIISNPYSLRTWSYNEFSSAKKLLSISNIKRIDVFKYLVRKDMEINQNNEMSSVYNIMVKCNVPINMVNYICSFIPKFGASMVLDMLYDNFNYDVILDGIIRDSWQVIIKDLELKYIWYYMHKHNITKINVSLVVSICEREIIKLIVQNNKLNRYTCS